MNMRFHAASSLVILVVALCAFTGTASAGASVGIDYTHFSGLYQRQKSLQETVDRLEKMENLRQSAQVSLERLMTQSPGNIELELRYGELIVQRGRDLDQFSLEIDAAGDTKRAKELKEQAHALLRQGLALHSKLLARAKNHPMAPKVYLGMARTQYGLGQKRQALDSADLGIQSLGKSAGLQEVEINLWMLRGDAAFDLAKAPLALESYSRALKLVQAASIEEAYLDYKIAWVHYNLKDSDTALKHLDHLFSVTRDKYALRQEAVQDYALFYADLSKENIEKRGGYKAVYEYLCQKGEIQPANRALERMAGIFAKNGRRNEAIGAHEFLISETALDPSNVDRALTIVEWSHALADKKKLVERYFWLVSEFGPRSAWYGAQAGKPQIQRAAADNIEASVRKFAISLHAEAGKEGSEEVRRPREDVVAKLYDVHIQNFSRDTDVPRAEAGRIHYYRAEIHRRRKEWADAGARYDQYLRILNVIPKDQLDNVDAKLRDDAIWGAVQVWAKAIDQDPKFVPSMIGSADRFLKDRPKDSRAPEVMIDAAKVELKSGLTAVAMARMERLVQSYPKTKQALESVNATLDALNKESDWVNLAQRSRLYLNSIDTWAPAGERPKIHAQLNKILSQTEAKACDALNQQGGRQLEAALCFESFAKGFEKDPQAPKALLGAADIYDKLKDPTAALGALEILVKKYTDTDYAQKGFSRLAAVYEKAFEFEKAIGVYETLLSRNSNIPDKEKITARLLDLLYSLGDQTRLNAWLENRKVSTDAMRKSYADRRSIQLLADLRVEENSLGFDGDGFVSTKAPKLFAEFETQHKLGRLTLEQEIEYRRLSGILHRVTGDMDRADQEWMAGLRLYWKAKERDTNVREVAARLRLEEASVWEAAFRNTDVMKNPTRKAELFQKLEAWYAEVVEMKAPVAALAALWKSADLNSSFAEEVRNSPIPPELLAAGAEAQRKAYLKLVTERTEPLKKKAVQIIERIAVKAREWKVVSPVVLSSLKSVSNLRSGVELPGQIVSVPEQQLLRFPWSDLPRWVDLSQEQSGWEDWKLSDEILAQRLGPKSERRSEARRAAFVTLVRKGSLTDPELAKWSRTFADRAGIQARIQAMIHDRDLSRAQLFLDQYENFFGVDAFSEHFWGRIEWARGNYSVAYQRWVRPTDGDVDFRTAYWAEGWSSLFDELIEGVPGRSQRSSVYSKLAPLAKTSWQKVYLGKLCVDMKAECSDDFVGRKLVSQLSDESEGPLSYAFEDDRSLWSVKRDALGALILSQVNRATKTEDLVDLRSALSGLYSMQNLTSRPKELMAHYWSLRRQVDERQDQIDRQAKQRMLAGAAP